MSYTLPKLPYEYNALEPNIDSKTMEIHHGKHHQGYTNNLNGAIDGTELEGKSIEDILENLDMNNGSVRNNGGGYFNHSLFWEIMSPNGGGSPTGELADAINTQAAKDAVEAVTLNGRRFDCGSVQGYLDAIMHVADRRKR